MSDGKLGAQPHYAGRGVEPIEAVEAWGLDFHLGSALKYIVRAGHKAGESREKDLTKALWYLRRSHDMLGKPRSNAGVGGVAINAALEAWNLPPLLAHAVRCVWDAVHDGVCTVDHAAVLVDEELARAK